MAFLKALRWKMWRAILLTKPLGGLEAGTLTKEEVVYSIIASREFNDRPAGAAEP